MPTLTQERMFYPSDSHKTTKRAGNQRMVAVIMPSTCTPYKMLSPVTSMLKKEQHRDTTARK